MPLQSKSQNRLFRWAKAHPAEAEREKGIKPAVTREFLASAHGKSLAGLPDHVERKAEGGAVRQRSTSFTMPARPFRW